MFFDKEMEQNCIIDVYRLNLDMKIAALDIL